MKKRIIALVGASVMLLSACATGSSVNDAKKLYEGKTYSVTQISKEFVATPEAELVKEKEDDINSYVSQYVADIKSHTVNLYDNLPTITANLVNFNARVDDEAEWAKTYGEEFTYEINDRAVSVTLSASKTVTKDEDKEAGFAVAYAFSYIANYNKEGLLKSSRLTIAVVKTNEKEKKDVAKYQVTSTLSVSW